MTIHGVAPVITITAVEGVGPFAVRTRWVAARTRVALDAVLHCAATPSDQTRRCRPSHQRYAVRASSPVRIRDIQLAALPAGLAACVTGIPDCCANDTSARGDASPRFLNPTPIGALPASSARTLWAESRSEGIASRGALVSDL